MAQLGFYFDMTRCIGCRTCQVACKDRWQIQGAGARPRRVETYETGEYPDAKMYHIAMSCNQCGNPACVAACPTGAMFKAEDGTMRYDESLCDGCGACVTGCPYGAPQLLETGKIARCDSCYTLREAGMNPVCVDACLMRCLDFGDVEELKAKYGTNLVSDVASLYDSTVTQPNLLIKATPASQEADYVSVII
ncbi:MAG: 4Fe-4S dicluster domain-containing protein [Lachnospiraceae bacterium]|nr:4Fe-4S dicluster domain-containing protein [Lachnospiraceae bacterium]